MDNDYSKKTLLPVDINDFDVNKITFEKVLTKGQTTPTIYMKYGDTKKEFQVILDSAEIRLMEFLNKKTNEMEYTISQALKGVDKLAIEKSEDTTSSAVLYNKLLDLEELVIKTAAKNSIDWFGKPCSEAVIREMAFQRIVKCSTEKGSKIPNGKYDPSMRIKVKVYENTQPNGTKKKIVHLSKPGIKDGDGNPVKLVPESIKQVFQNGMQAILSISCKVYTQPNGSFGVTWTLESGEIFPNKDAEDASESLFKNKKKPVNTVTTTLKESEEDDEEVEEDEQEAELTQIEEAPAPAPAPAPVPAPVRKKRGPVVQG